MTSIDSYQPVHPCILIRVYTFHLYNVWSLNNLLVNTIDYDQAAWIRRLMWVFADCKCCQVVFSIWWCYSHMGHAMWKCVFRDMQTVKAQISLCIHAVWLGSSLSANRMIGYYRMFQWRANAQMTLGMWRMMWICTFSFDPAHIVLFFHYTYTTTSLLHGLL